MQNFHYHFLKTNNELTLIAADLRRIFDSILEKAISLTEEVETDIVVRHSPINSIPELGSSGQYTKDARCIDIYLDLDNPHLKSNFETEIARTLIHEYMHVVREQYVPWENGTLLDSLIAEGLTQSFEIEVQPALPPSIYTTSFTNEELDNLCERYPFLKTKILSSINQLTETICQRKAIALPRKSKMKLSPKSNTKALVSPLLVNSMA